MGGGEEKGGEMIVFDKKKIWRAGKREGWRLRETGSRSDEKREERRKGKGERGVTVEDGEEKGGKEMC